MQPLLFLTLPRARVADVRAFVYLFDRRLLRAFASPYGSHRHSSCYSKAGARR